MSNPEITKFTKIAKDFHRACRKGAAYGALELIKSVNEMNREVSIGYIWPNAVHFIALQYDAAASTGHIDASKIPVKERTGVELAAKAMGLKL